MIIMRLIANNELRVEAIRTIANSVSLHPILPSFRVIVRF